MEVITPLYSALSEDKLIKKQLKEFVLKLPEKIDKCEEIIQKNDWQDLKQYCHKIKGAFSTYGYPELHELATKMEIISSSSFTQETREYEATQILQDLIRLVERTQLVYQ